MGMEHLGGRRGESVTPPQLDLSLLTQREKELLSEARELAENIEQNNKQSLHHYYDLGKIVGQISLSHRQLADRIARRGFGHATLSDSALFYNYVQKNQRGDLDAFIVAMEKDPIYEDTTVSWRNVRDYIRRDRSAVSQGEREADEQFHHKEAIAFEAEFRELEQLSDRLRRKWDDLSQDIRQSVRHHLKASRHNLNMILGLEASE
jgi:hypothetical protein